MASNQIDFHTYCIRKWTLREYLEYISFNDNIYKDKKYIEAAAYAIDNLFEFTKQIEIEASKPKQEETKEEEAKKKKKKNKNKTQEVEELSPDQAFRKKFDYYGKEYDAKIRANPLE